MKISLVAAVDKELGIGKNNRLLCHLPADLKIFKQITSGHPIIMGRKTYESMGRALPNRTNILVSRSGFTAEGCITVSSLQQALEEAQKADPEIAFVIGGGEIFKEAIHIADELCLSHIHHTFGADTFFPPIPAAFTCVDRIDHKADEKNLYDFTFCRYERR